MIPDRFKVEPMRADILNKIRSRLETGTYDAIIVGTDSDVEGNGIYDLLETCLGLQNMKAYRFFESDLTKKIPPAIRNANTPLIAVV